MQRKTAVGKAGQAPVNGADLDEVHAEDLSPVNEYVEQREENIAKLLPKETSFLRTTAWWQHGVLSLLSRYCFLPTTHDQY